MGFFGLGKQSLLEKRLVDEFAAGLTPRIGRTVSATRPTRPFT